MTVKKQVTMLNKHFTINEDVIFKVIEGEAVLVFVKSAMIMSLNGSGTYILEQLSKNKLPVSFNDLLVKMREKYDASEETLMMDLEDFLVKLHKNNLITLN